MAKKAAIKDGSKWFVETASGYAGGPYKYGISNSRGAFREVEVTERWIGRFLFQADGQSFQADAINDEGLFVVRAK